MSKVRAGDIRQLTINGREFDPAPESSCNVLLGGYANEYSQCGNGEDHIKQSRKGAGITDLSLSVDDSRQDLEFLQEAQDSGESVPVTLTLASGVAYAGSLVVVADELGKSTGEGTVSISLRGKRFEQI